MLGFVRRHPMGLSFAVVLIGLIAFGIYRFTQSGPVGGMAFGDVPVVISRAAPMTFVDRIEALGTARANESVEVTAKVTDTVQRVNFEDGKDVKAGEVLVELTRTEEAALLDEAVATLAEAQQQFERIEDLVRRGSASRARLDEQTRIRDAAKARVDALEARLSDRLIRAPFSGVLGFRQVSPGTLISPGTVITTLDDIDVIKLDFPVPENFIGALRPGLAIEALTPAYQDREFKGTITTIESRVDPATRSVRVRAEIPNPDHVLRPGMLMTVEVIKARAEVLAVPEEALVPISDRQYVYRLKDDNTVERVQVEIGRRHPGVVEVTSGLEPGDRVVTEGSVRLRPGMAVQIREERALPAAG